MGSRFGIRSCAVNLEAHGVNFPEKKFGKDTTSRISGAEEEDFKTAFVRIHGELPSLAGLPARAVGCFFAGRDEIDAAEELAKAGAGNLVVNADASFLTDEQARLLHHGKMLGKGGDIAPCQLGQFIHALFAMRKAFHDEQARGMGHRLHDGGAIGGVFFKRAEWRCHIWQIRQIKSRCQGKPAFS